MPDALTVTWVDQIASTQLALVAQARDGAPPQALATTHQTAGHGRRDRVWVCPPGGGLALSVLLRPRRSDAWTWLPLLTGVAVVTALDRLRGGASGLTTAPLRLKWPNDVLGPGGAKLAGILAERVDQPSVPPACVLGVGVNLLSADLPEGAVGLDRLGVACSAAQVAQELLDAVTRWLARWEEDEPAVQHAYRDLCATLGHEVRVSLPDGTEVSGSAVGVDAHGRLVVRPDGSQDVALSAGDVAHVRPR